MKAYDMSKAKFVNVEVGTRCLVAEVASGRTIFGEYGTVTKELKNHLVITTDSGTVLKVNDMFHPVGKFSNYFASLNIENRDNLIISKVSHWNDKTLKMEYK